MLFQLSFPLTAHRARGSDTALRTRSQTCTCTHPWITALQNYLHNLSLSVFRKITELLLPTQHPFAACDQGMLAANTRARHLDGADAAPVGRVNNLVNPASNCKSLRSQMAFWRIFFFFFTFLMHCFPNSSAQQMYRKYWQNSIWTLMYLWDWLSPNTE